MCHKSDST